jgi:hypothetical protein
MTHENSRYLGALPIAAILFGSLLVASSWLPWENWVGRNAWTEADSDAFEKVRIEAHADYGDLRVRAEAARLAEKLDDAKQAPERVSRYLLWSGAALAACGGTLHLLKSSR